MFGALVVLGVVVVSFMAWRAWVRSQEMNAMRDQARRAAAELEETMKRHLELQRSINARMKDLHRSLANACCGRETTWSNE
jgi:predicted Holliday junction resolvase-like endonuclease